MFTQVQNVSWNAEMRGFQTLLSQGTHFTLEKSDGTPPNKNMNTENDLVSINSRIDFLCEVWA